MAAILVSISVFQVAMDRVRSVGAVNQNLGLDSIIIKSITVFRFEELFLIFSNPGRDYQCIPIRPILEIRSCIRKDQCYC